MVAQESRNDSQILLLHLEMYRLCEEFVLLLLPYSQCASQYLSACAKRCRAGQRYNAEVLNYFIVHKFNNIYSDK